MPSLNQALTPSMDDKFKRASVFMKERSTIGPQTSKVVEIQRKNTGQPLSLLKQNVL